MQCIDCGRPVALETGWVLNATKSTALCGMCAREFARWYKARMGQMGALLKGQKESFAECMAKSTKCD